MSAHLTILFFALVLDWFLGEPEVVWKRLPHPVVLFGKAVSVFDRGLCNPKDTPHVQYKKGAVAITALILIALFAGLLLRWAFSHLGPLWWVGELIIVFTLLAQKSLHDHVSAVRDGLRDGGLEGGREAVAMIVGRDPKTLDRSGVCRAAIESLAENFSDGVVAPAFWYAVFGLPGILTYKMINTADSMIAHRTERYLHFGRETARIDDLANWVPARLSAYLIALGAFFVGGLDHVKDGLRAFQTDSGLHRSPNAGWPEAAMAGVAGIALGGPRIYDGETVQQAHLNGSGRRNLDRRDITACLKYFSAACFVFWASVIVANLIL